MRKMRLETGEIDLTLTLRRTPTAERVWAAAPFEGTAQTWGEEVYFAVDGVDAAREPDARELLTTGEIAYWPDGNAVAIAFGQTPISAPGEVRLASPSNIWADTDEDVTLLAAARPGDLIRLSRL